MQFPVEGAANGVLHCSSVRDLAADTRFVSE